MRTINGKFQQMVSDVPQDIMTEVDLSFAIAEEINTFMLEKGLTKKQLADALGKKPSEITKWISGTNNGSRRHSITNKDSISVKSKIINE